MALKKFCVFVQYYHEQKRVIFVSAYIIFQFKPIPSRKILISGFKSQTTFLSCNIFITQIDIASIPSVT